MIDLCSSVQVAVKEEGIKKVYVFIRSLSQITQMLARLWMESFHNQRIHKAKYKKAVLSTKASGLFEKLIMA